MSERDNLVVRFVKTPPPGPLAADVFSWEKEPLAELQDGEILVRHIYLSIDAGSRAQLDERTGYVIHASAGKVMMGAGAVAEVVESRHEQWRAGDVLAVAYACWQSYQVIRPDTETLFRVDPTVAPIAMHLGALGWVGFTAFIGIFEVGKPLAGETVLVSAAAGATGSLAGQFAKISGARVVGIAGGAQKCALVKEQFGFDDCIDYKRGDIGESIAGACPEGVDVYYDNVGGEIQRAAFAHMNTFGRVALCGQVTQYSGEGAAPGPNLMVAVRQRLTVRGFLVSDHLERREEFVEAASRWYREGRLQHQVTVTQGLENIHEAINSLTLGHNLGKQLCQVADEPAH
jgi:NADPH-dependent curcumin reductase